MKLCKNLMSFIIASIITITMVGCNRSKSTSDGTPIETEITSDSTEVTTTKTETTTSNTGTTASSSSETTTTTTATTQIKKKSALRVTDKSKDLTYRGEGFCMNGYYRFHEEPDMHSEIIEEVQNGEVLVTDYRYDESGDVWFKVSGHKGWSNEVSCPIYNYLKVAFDICYKYNGTNLYAVYDIDNDGTAEWIFQYGKSASQYVYKVYSVVQNLHYADEIGTIPYGALYVDSKGNLITKVEKMGHESAYQVEYHNGSLNYELIFENSGLDEYTNPGEVVPTNSVYSLVDSSKYYHRSSNGHNMNNIIECENCGEYYDSSEYDYCPYCFYDWEPDETDYNLFCDNCGYKGFTTGVGVEGIICPDCGHYIIDPDPHYIEETEYTTQEYDEPNTEYVPPETDPITDPPVEPDPIETDPVYDDPVEEE